MKISEWAAEISELSYSQADALLTAFDTIAHHLPEFPEEFEGFDMLREMTWVYAEALAKKAEEQEHSCTCGGNCKSSPEILCFTCKKKKWRNISIVTGEAWLLHDENYSECGELLLNGRLFTKCNKYEPQEESE